MKAVNYGNVELNSGFLYEKQQLNKNVTINAVYDRFYETGRIKAFDFDWKEGMEQKPHVYWDSDVAKWAEGAIYILRKESNSDLEAKVEALIDKIEEHQCSDGYFNIYFTVCEPEKRFTDRDMHELYCAGHLFETAVAYYEATGRDRLLKIMEKYADCIIKAFVEEKTAKFITPGHEEIELALMRMYRATGNKKFLELAGFFINNRGVTDESEFCSLTNKFGFGNLQDDKPVREQMTATGHCVRACYLYSGMADYACETNDKDLYNACKAIFDDIVTKQMYITGGIGSMPYGEQFADGYDLKNDRSYAETCAAISLIYFAHRMMQFENDAMYADVIERILYNGMISGLSLDGEKFFYENAMEINLRNNKRMGKHYPITERVKVFDCSCCPPNLNRILASLGEYVYGYDGDTVYVNQFVGSTAEINGMKLVQTTDFPKNGEIKITAENLKTLCIRIPQWCENFDINAEYTIQNGYAVVENPCEVTVNLEIKPFLVQANAELWENNGKVALCVGPYVCAAESVDNIENLSSIFIDKTIDTTYTYSDEMSGYIVKAKAHRKITDGKLYSRYTEDFEDITLNMIPYASYANRGESNMRIWFNVK